MSHVKKVGVWQAVKEMPRECIEQKTLTAKGLESRVESQKGTIRDSFYEPQVSGMEGNMYL